MTIATTDEHKAAAESLRGWASSVAPIATMRAGGAGSWRQYWPALTEFGLFEVALAEEHGGLGGTVADLAVLLEQTADDLVGGPVLATALAALITRGAVAEGAPCGMAVPTEAPTAKAVAAGDGWTVTGAWDYVYGADADTQVLLPADTVDGVRWLLIPAADVTITTLANSDHTVPLARVTAAGVAVAATHGFEPAADVTDLFVALAVAELAGVAGWCLRTAVDYAKVREQFGKPIGSFQAVKHMCAEMLLRSEQISVTAADAARAVSESDDSQLSIAAAVAAAAGVDAAEANAKDCIQVLGGIGITWEHEAHLYLRRAYGISHALGGRRRWIRRVSALTQQGVRRELRIDLESVADLRPEISAAVAEVAALSEDKRQVALAESGLLAPHWPRPYGRNASPAEQLLIDQELAAAEVERPDLVIGWWAVPTILEHGSAEQIDQFVPATLRGDLAWCQLFSEPGAGSDLAALRMKAVRAEGPNGEPGWKLTGQKVWTSAAQKAHWGVCLARTDADAPKHKGITYFLIDMKSPGIEIRPLREITGDELFNEVFFDDVFVPDEMVVGTVNDGWRLARTTLANERVAMAGGTALGNPMEELLRTLGAQPEVDPADLDRLGGLILTAQVGSLLDQRIAQLAVSGQDTGAQASSRKLIGVRYRQTLAEFRLELSDGGGAVRNREVHDFLNTRCLTIAGGTEQILLTVAGERLLGLPR